MSQIPPPMSPPFNPGGMSYSMQPPPRRTSAAAVTSLICGILGCVPFLTGFVAVIFGIVGILATRKPNVGGRVLAIIGLVLGLLSLAGWGVMAGVGGFAYLQTGPSRTVAKQYLQDVNSGNISAAEAESATGTTPAEIQDLADQMKKWGGMNDVTFASFNTVAVAGQPTRTTLGGIVQFPTGPKSVVIILVKVGTAEKVESATIK